jgi:hypothetical protein
MRTIASKTFQVTVGNNYTVTVGAGGTQGDQSTVTNGVDSVLFGDLETISSAGGGKGAA